MLGLSLLTSYYCFSSEKLALFKILQGSNWLKDIKIDLVNKEV